MKKEDIVSGMAVFTYDGDEYEVSEIVDDGVVAYKMVDYWCEETESTEWERGSKEFLIFDALYEKAPVSEAEEKLEKLQLEIKNAQLKLDDLTTKIEAGDDSSFVAKVLNSERIVVFYEDTFGFLDTNFLKAKRDKNYIEISAKITVYTSGAVYHHVGFTNACYGEKLDPKNILFNPTEEEVEAEFKKRIPAIWEKNKTASAETLFYYFRDEKIAKYFHLFPEEVFNQMKQRALDFCYSYNSSMRSSIKRSEKAIKERDAIAESIKSVQYSGGDHE